MSYKRRIDRLTVFPAAATTRLWFIAVWLLTALLPLLLLCLPLLLLCLSLLGMLA